MEKNPRVEVLVSSLLRPMCFRYRLRMMCLRFTNEVLTKRFNAAATHVEPNSITQIVKVLDNVATYKEKKKWMCSIRYAV